MINGQYAYFGSNRNRAFIDLTEINLLGSWDAASAYAATRSDAVYYSNGTYLCLIDNSNFAPTTPVASTRALTWSPLALLSANSAPIPIVSAINIGGNTDGTTADATGSVFLIGGDNVTLSQQSNTISFIAGGGTGGGGGAAISAGTQSQNTGTVIFSNSNGVSFGLSSDGKLTASVQTNYQSPGAYLTTAMQSNASTISNINISAGTLSNNLSALTFSNSNGISFGLDTNSVITATVATNYQSAGAYLTTAMLSNAATISNINISAGSTSSNLSAFTFANSNSVTFGLGTGTAAGIITASISAGTGGGGAAISAGTNSQNTGTVSFVDSNGVSFGLDTNGSLTATVVTNYQTPGAYLTTAMLSNAATISNIKVSAGASSSNVSAITFSNGSGVTFGYDGTNITASVKTDYQTSGAYLTTAMLSNAATISNIKISGGTLSNNLSALTFGDSNGVSWGLNTNSVITATVQTNYLTTAMLSNAATISNIKVSAGASSSNVSAITFSNGSGVTWGYDGTNITASVATSYLTTAMLSNAATISNIKVSAGASSSNVSAITFSNGSGVTWGYDGTNITASVATSYLTTAMLSNAATISNIKVSAGASSSNVSAITFSNGSGVTWGYDGTNITASVATSYLTTAALSQNTSNYAGINSAITGGSLTVNTSGISINLPAYLTTAALSSQTLQFTLGGNTATTNSSQIANGGFILAGGNNLTIQQNNNTISLSVGNYITTADLSQNSSKYAGLNSAITGGSLTVNTSGISINLPAYLTTAALSQNTSNYAGVNSAITGGSLTVNTSGVSINLPAYLTTAAQSSQTLQFTLGGNTATTNSSQIANGGFILAGGNNVTIQQNNNSISFSVGNYITTADLSQNSSKYAGLNSAITGGSLTVNTSGISINLPAYLTTAALSQNTSNYAGINSAITGGSLTVNTSGVSINLPAYLTTAMLSNAATISNIKISAGASSSNVSAITFSNGSGVSFGYDGTNITASVAAGGNINLSAGSTSTNATAFTFNNSNGVSFGLGTGTAAGVITASAAGGGTTNQTGPNISAGTDSLFTGGTVTFGNAFGISHVTSNGSVVASNALLSAWSLAGNNTAGTNNSAQGSALYLSAGAGLTLSGSSNTIVISSPVCGWLEPNPMTNTATLAKVAGSFYFAPFIVPEVMSGGRINLLVINTSTASLFRDVTMASYVSSSTGGLGQSYTFSKVLALYSQGAGANSTALLSFWSNSFSWAWSKSVSVSSSNVSQFNITVAHSISYIADIGSDGAYTKSQFTSSNSTAIANSSTASNWGDSIAVSIRNMLSTSVIFPVGLNTTIAPGAYWLAGAFSSTRASATTANWAGGSALDFSQSGVLGISRLVLESAWRNWGSTATAARSHLMPYGVYTGAANLAPPATVNLSSDLSSLGSAWIKYFNFQYRGLTN